MLKWIQNLGGEISFQQQKRLSMKYIKSILCQALREKCDKMFFQQYCKHREEVHRGVLEMQRSKEWFLTHIMDMQ